MRTVRAVMPPASGGRGIHGAFTRPLPTVSELPSGSDTIHEWWADTALPSNINDTRSWGQYFMDGTNSVLKSYWTMSYADHLRETVVRANELQMRGYRIVDIQIHISNIVYVADREHVTTRIDVCIQFREYKASEKQLMAKHDTRKPLCAWHFQLAAGSVHAGIKRETAFIQKNRAHIGTVFKTLNNTYTPLAQKIVGQAVGFSVRGDVTQYSVLFYPSKTR